MKDKKTKNHKENWIGNIIRGFLLFMPLLAIGVTCAYAIFNKNAYESYSLLNDNQTQYYDLTELEQFKTYKVTGKTGGYGLQTSGTSNYIYVSNFQVLRGNPGSVGNATFDINNTDYLQVYKTSNNILEIELHQTNQSGYYYVLTSGDFTFSFNYVSSRITTTDINSIKMFYRSIVPNYNQLDNIFYYSIDKVQQSPLFNWSTDTGMYNVIHGACTTLGIESTFVPFLLAYWLLTYLIYIIYDIALLIVNMAHNKIHDVESSI